MYDIHLLQAQRPHAACVRNSKNTQVLKFLISIHKHTTVNRVPTVVPPPTSQTSSTSLSYATGKPVDLDQTGKKPYIEQPRKLSCSMNSCCLGLSQSNINLMIRIPAKSSPLNCGSESFDGRYRFPGCRDAEDKFNICILPSISQFAFQLLLNRLVQKSEEIAISAKVVRMMSI